jgi:GAF domain-containing protein
MSVWLASVSSFASTRRFSSTWTSLPTLWRSSGNGTRQGCRRWAAAYCERRFPVTTSRILSGDTILWTSLDDIPREAADDRRAFAQLGLCSMVAVPLVSGGSVRGTLAMATLGDRSLSDADVDQLRLVVDVLANARAQRQAEMEAVRSRQELAYVARRPSMGELAASMAHQLNQPLTGILSNAQAASACSNLP